MEAITSLQASSDLKTSSSASNMQELNKGQLGVDDFLKLLTTQLSNQNPMEPMSDLDFLGQMAQFSSLNEMHGLTKSFESMASTQNALSANQYLGKEVSVKAANGKQLSGTVTAVNYDDGNEVKITVDGEKFKLSDVLSVNLSTTPAA